MNGIIGRSRTVHQLTATGHTVCGADMQGIGWKRPRVTTATATCKRCERRSNSLRSGVIIAGHSYDWRVTRINGGEVRVVATQHNGNGDYPVMVFDRSEIAYRNGQFELSN